MQKMRDIVRKQAVLFILLTLSVVVWGKRVASGDITMESYHQNTSNGTATLTLRNNTEEDVTHVRAALTYMSVTGKTLGKDNINNDVRIRPHSTARIHVNALPRTEFIYYKQVSELTGEQTDERQPYMVAFELKDYASGPLSDEPAPEKGRSPMVWHIIRITLGLTILGILVLIWIIIPTKILMKRRNRRLELVLLLMSCSLALSAVNPSGTLPIIHITTENGGQITRDDYINGTMYIDNTASVQDEFGTAALPKEMKIRGRGNYTWKGFDKKPFKIKLEESSRLLGMPKSKHWALMAGADDGLGFMRNTLGFLLGQHIGMRWTPHQVPVELVINGEYRGLYLLTETIRIQKNRVNIAEQPSMNEDPLTLSGGWLLEIDNYESDGQVRIQEGNGQEFRISIDTPDSVSELQFAYISSQMRTLNAAFYEGNSRHWEQLVDLDEIVKFYLVQEIIENCESFHGSCYMYRDQGTNAKWYFGPVWDFGNAYWRLQEKSIYDNPSFDQYWIGQIASFTSFRMRLDEFWYDFLTQQYEQVEDDLLAFKNEIKQAAVRDADRWDNHGQVCTSRDMEAKYNQMISNLHWRVNYLRSVWGDGVQALPQVEETSDRTAVKTFIDGQMVIIRDGVRYSVTGIRLDN